MSSPLVNENTALAPDETVPPDETVQPDETDELVAERLVEEVSIDGMCGVY